MYILGYQGISWVSKAIRLQTRSIYSHIAVELPDGTVVEAWHKGGILRNKDFKEVHTKGTKVDVFKVKGKYKMKDVIHFLASQQGKGYDFGAIARFLSRRDERADNKWFCSELAIEAFRRGGLDLLLRIPSSHVSPRDLTLSPLLEYVETRIV